MGCGVCGESGNAGTCRRCSLPRRTARNNPHHGRPLATVSQSAATCGTNRAERICPHISPGTRDGAAARRCASIVNSGQALVLWLTCPRRPDPPPAHGRHPEPPPPIPRFMTTKTTRPRRRSGASVQSPLETYLREINETSLLIGRRRAGAGHRHRRRRHRRPATAWSAPTCGWWSTSPAATPARA